MSNIHLPESIKAIETLMPLAPAQRERFSAYVALVKKWQPVKNLVAPSTLGQIWSRHIADSVQAHLALPCARRWVDIGSGAGFPGLVTAILLADESGAQVHLCESNGRKAAFLLTVARELGLPVKVHGERIEKIAGQIVAAGDVEAVSARALASFDELLSLAEPWLAAGAVGVFHKGQDFGAENQIATQSWAYDLLEIESRTDRQGRIIVVRNVVKRD